MSSETAADVRGPLLAIHGLKTWFSTRAGSVRAIDGVDLIVDQGETLAIVGESGSGKSVTGLSIMGLIQSPPGRIVEGRIEFTRRDGSQVDLATLPRPAMRRIRGREIAMIFQEPMTSLDPLFTVGEQIAETLRLHEGLDRGRALLEAIKLLDLVEIPDAKRRAGEYPHQMSGGMRQRVMIALALACRPKLLIADEPTTALDVTIQAQILDLLRRLQADIGMAMLFITHNLGLVVELAHRVAVMYAGRVVETGTVSDLFRHPRHPYTRGLLACVPRLGRGRAGGRLSAIPGSIGSPLARPPGCGFEPRCALASAECRTAMPELAEVGTNHRSRCIHWATT
jgi:oligopeptide/dipeptide ABC transporter ATP-binding protein